jgi:hypothetical protein
MDWLILSLGLSVDCVLDWGTDCERIGMVVAKAASKKTEVRRNRRINATRNTGILLI